MTSQHVPEGRYGSRARRRNRPVLRWLLFALTLVVLLAGTIIAYNNLGNPPIQGKQTAFSVIDDHSVNVTVEVRRNEPQRPAECVIRARDVGGNEIGRKEVLIHPAGDTSRERATLRTSTRAVIGEVYGCSYNVPEYLSTP